ncbi:hypothetical protein B6N13_19620 [Marinomonas sp. UCMA 3892]|nr:hypothetical protein [Marinomonas sp. UCMA 3892]
MGYPYTYLEDHMNINSHSRAEIRSITSHSDTWTGLVLLTIGLTAAWLANDFDTISRPYPLALGIIMAVLGLIIITRVFLNKGNHTSFALHSKVAVSAGTIIALWILAMTNGLGYIIPTFFMEVAFLLICGFQKLYRAIIVASLISGISYMIFIVGLGVRLPEPFLSWLL